MTGTRNGNWKLGIGNNITLATIPTIRPGAGSRSGGGGRCVRRADGHAEEAGAGGGGGGGIDGAPAVRGRERVAPPERVGAGGAEVGRPADARFAGREVRGAAFLDRIAGFSGLTRLLFFVALLRGGAGAAFIISGCVAFQHGF